MAPKNNAAKGKAEPPSRFMDGIDRLIAVAEKDRFTVLTGFIYLMAIMLTRAWLEGTVFGYASMNLYFYAWQITFFAAVFMGTVAVLSFFSGAGFRRTCNVTLFMFWIIVLPPLLDYFVFGTSGLENAVRYSYLNRDTILNFLMPFSGEMRSTWGLVVQGWYVMAVVSLYLWKRTGSAVRGLSGCVGVFLMALFMASKPFLLTTEYVATGAGYEAYITLLSVLRFPILSYYGWLPDTAYIGALIYQQKVLFYIAFNLILLMTFLLLALFVSSRELFRGFVRSFRMLRHGHFIFMCMVGVVMVRVADPGFTDSLALDPLYILHFPYMLLIALSMFFTWQFTTMLNDIHDLDIDREAHPDRGLVTGTLSRVGYMQFALMFGLLACCTSAVLGLIPFLLIAACLALGIIYSVPPVRFRDHPASSLTIGLGSMLAYFLGMYSPGHWEVVYWEVLGNEIVYETVVRFNRIPPLTPDALIVGLMILVALTLAPMLTQMRDYEGDRKAGARTIYTHMGYDRGRRLVSITVPLLFLLPLAVIHGVADLVILPLLALLSYIVLSRSNNIMPVFGLYFVAALYSLVRIVYV